MLFVMTPRTLPSRWRTLAEQQRKLGADSQAHTLEYCADELERIQREWELEALTLEQAAEESGYSYSAIQSKVASGEIQNLGVKHSPRVRRCDLPRKSSRAKPEAVPDLAGEILLTRISGE